MGTVPLVPYFSIKPPHLPKAGCGTAISHSSFLILFRILNLSVPDH